MGRSAAAKPTRKRTDHDHHGDLQRALLKEALRTMHALVDSILEQQEAGLIRRDDPVLLARFVWSLVHGLAMLAIDGQFRAGDAHGDALSRYATERLRAAIGSGEGIA